MNVIRCEHIFQKGRAKDIKCGRICEIGNVYCNIHNRPPRPFPGKVKSIPIPKSLVSIGCNSNVLNI